MKKNSFIRPELFLVQLFTNNASGKTGSWSRKSKIYDLCQSHADCRQSTAKIAFCDFAIEGFKEGAWYVVKALRRQGKNGESLTIKEVLQRPTFRATFDVAEQAITPTLTILTDNNVWDIVLGEGNYVQTLEKMAPFAIANYKKSLNEKFADANLMQSIFVESENCFTIYINDDELVRMTYDVVTGNITVNGKVDLNDADFDRIQADIRNKFGVISDCEEVINEFNEAIENFWEKQDAFDEEAKKAQAEASRKQEEAQREQEKLDKKNAIAKHKAWKKQQTSVSVEPAEAVETVDEPTVIAGPAVKKGRKTAVKKDAVEEMEVA